MDALGLRFGKLLQTGAHRASARAVAEGRAAFACLDAVTWRQIERWDDWAGALNVIARTDPTPGLTFVTGGTTDPSPYRAAMADALRSLSETDRDLLGLQGMIPLERARYLALPTPAAPPE